MPLFNRKIAVIIPAYRAAHSLPAVLGSIPAFIDHIVVVDDGSGDRTADAARAFPDPRVTLVVHEANQGVGGAVLSGYARAHELGCAVFVKMDADGQMKPEHLPELLAPILEGRADYAKGNRFAHADRLQAMPLLRRLGNTIHSYMTKFATGHWHIFDATNGYTAITAETYRKLEHDYLAKGYFFETSMLFELNVAEARIVDVDIPAVYEGEQSHIRSHQITVRFPLLLIRGWVLLIHRRHFRRKRRR